MVLIIPMSGQGKRFAATGYEQLKPLITVEGMPTIAHVLDLYPGEDVPLFICNQAHLETTPMRSILETLRPNGKIISITGKGQGPVPDIRQVYENISDTEDVMISYCDFTGRWDYAAFKATVKKLNVDGAIPSYIGFHPHLLGPDFYGHMRWKKDPVTGADLMLEMQEKKAFTDNKMNEYGAVGNYWFKSGALMKTYFDEAIKNDYKTGHEFFCSMPYNYLVRDGLKVWIPEMQQFCQWGTPHDLEEYEAWSRSFAVLAGAPERKGITNIPATRQSLIKARTNSLENLCKTAAYWATFFTQVPWHPYGKTT